MPQTCCRRYHSTEYLLTTVAVHHRISHFPSALSPPALLRAGIDPIPSPCRYGLAKPKPAGHFTPRPPNTNSNFCFQCSKGRSNFLRWAPQVFSHMGSRLGTDRKGQWHCRPARGTKDHGTIQTLPLRSICRYSLVERQ